MYYKMGPDSTLPLYPLDDNLGSFDISRRTLKTLVILYYMVLMLHVMLMEPIHWYPLSRS